MCIKYKLKFVKLPIRDGRNEGLSLREFAAWHHKIYVRIEEILKCSREGARKVESSVSGKNWANK